MKTYNKKLYKSRENRIIGGVMGGIGEYFEIDPSLLRVGYILLSIFSAAFPGIIAYVFMMFVVPEKPGTIHEDIKQ